MRISPISKISCNSIQKRPSQKISFGISIPLLTDIKTLNGVRPIFAKKVEDSIHAFPEKYKEILEANKSRSAFLGKITVLYSSSFSLKVRIVPWVWKTVRPRLSTSFFIFSKYSLNSCSDFE